MRKYREHDEWDDNNVLGYDEHTEWLPDRDIALCTTLYLPGGYWMRHEPNDACWCEPESVVVTDHYGEPVGYVVLHRERQ